MQPLTASPAPSTQDQYLWQLARRRVKFQGHLLVYLLVNGGLWALYLLTLGEHRGPELLPWPIWSTVFWGLGLLNQGLCAYTGLSRGERVQREYERLRAQAASF